MKEHSFSPDKENEAFLGSHLCFTFGVNVISSVQHTMFSHPERFTSELKLEVLPANKVQNTEHCVE